MADKNMEECNTILAGFLGENTVRDLRKRHEENYNSIQFLKDIFDIMCDRFPSDFDQGNEVYITEGSCSFRLSDFVLQIFPFFSSQILLQTSTEYLEEHENTEGYVQCWKMCKIVVEIMGGCSFEWLVGLGVNVQDELNTLESSDLEKTERNIVEFINALLKLINIMALNVEELRSSPRLNLFPIILQLCHLILEKNSKNSGSTIQDELFKNFMSRILKKVLCELVMTCLQQIEDQSWVSECHKKISLEMLEFLIVKLGGLNVIDLLSGSDSKADSTNVCIFPNGLLHNILDRMKTFMAKDKLPDCPVAVHVLVWSIIKVKHPFLGKHISMILPPLLLLLDDYRVDNQIIGIQILAHVIENTNATELCWYGRADIIYHALHHRMYTNEAQVMHVLQPCLLKIIKVIELSPKKAVASFNKCGENFQMTLTAMEYESKILMRRAYCNSLASYIKHMGITVVRHFKRLLRVIYGYLEIGDGVTEEWRIVMLDVLKCVILTAWPRIPNHADDILRCLMKLVIDISMSSMAPTKVKQLIFEKIENCLVILMCVCGETVKKQLECMTKELGETKAEQLIARALDLHKSS